MAGSEINAGQSSAALPTSAPVAELCRWLGELAASDPTALAATVDVVSTRAACEGWDPERTAAVAMAAALAPSLTNGAAVDLGEVPVRAPRRGVSVRERVVAVLADGPAQPSTIADTIDADKHQTSRALRGLLDAGVVEVCDPPVGADRRSRFYRLTEN